MRPYARAEPHVGEWKLTIRADTPEELFGEAARVVSRECGPASGPPSEWEHISLSARDAETLLADWLNELLGRSEVNGRAYDEVRRLELADGRLEADVRGRSVMRWRSPLKAATYHGLKLQQRGGRWTAVVLFDV
jgi:SHS2 domain-containing protein